MTVHCTPWTMTSDRSPEYAFLGSDQRAWRLSWLPERRLGRTQALAGIELDELVSNPELVDDVVAQAAIAERAEILDLTWQQAVVLLSTRILSRMAEELGADPAIDPDNSQDGDQAQTVPVRRAPG